MKQHQKTLDGFKKQFQERMARRTEEEKNTLKIAKKNRDLIAYWDSIPWYKFWLKPSFEEQRSIITSNWSSLNKNE